MGYYVQTDGLHGKAETIAKEHGGEILIALPTWADAPEGKALICMVGGIT